MTSPRFPVEALSTWATPSIPAWSRLALQVAGGVGELGEDEDLLVGKFFRLEQPAELLELVVVFGLELPGLGREVRKLVEITKGFRDHGRHIKLLSVQLF